MCFSNSVPSINWFSNENGRRIYSIHCSFAFLGWHDTSAPTLLRTTLSDTTLSRTTFSHATLARGEDVRVRVKVNVRAEVSLRANIVLGSVGEPFFRCYFWPPFDSCWIIMGTYFIDKKFHLNLVFLIFSSCWSCDLLSPNWGLLYCLSVIIFVRRKSKILVWIPIWIESKENLICVQQNLGGKFDKSVIIVDRMSVLLILAALR